MPRKIWRGGMIGSGAWSEIQLTAWAGVANAQIVALCDRHPDRRDPVVRRFNIHQTYDDFETMLGQAELDFVDICTRPYSHATLTNLAAERGLPALCQKPFCTSLEEAHEVVRFCQAAGVPLMVNENYRWQAWYRRIKELLDAGSLGTPFFARLHERSRLSLPKFTHPQRYLAEMPRLIVYEMGTHFLDTLRFLFGEPESIYARLHHVSPYMQGEDVQLITVGYPGLTALINHSWASVPIPGLDRTEVKHKIVSPPRLEIDGTEGTLILKADGSLHLFTDTAHRQWQFPQDVVPQSHVAAQQHFVDCLEGGLEFETSGAATLKTMALVYAAYLSATEERVVRI
jgi:predicted dehydrogenase